ncbi:arsenate reductase [Flavihumibacter rivuli]|uniref:arsenate reductase family protein n=1 Tax=Flavihumibacter rivuli TaxID=2838156 RepID=UPI001BDDCAE3|nr:ArsC/Spx/MgsR family protein [Flavihumibacter rivuli]ULQ56068.1 arsenate reductase [Flavihumibacter rivuli]
MKKIYHLANCGTCQKILKEVQAEKKGVVLQDIKTEPITAEQLDEMKKLAGSYEALFSRKAMKYRSMGLHEKELTEKDYRKLILDEYTFLKRPVAVVNGSIFIGNTKAVVESLKQAL